VPRGVHKRKINRVTIPILRPFQAEFIGEIYQAWAQGAQNVMGMLATGGGKTVCLSHIVREEDAAAVVIAHRQELVGQLSLTLAKYGIRHNIVASAATVKAIARAHVEELGRTFYDPGARVCVASVDTIIRRQLPDSWLRQVTLGVIDEGHHVVEDNKWHDAMKLFTNPAIRWLLPTATPKRADGKGLGRGYGGLADIMVRGPEMRWLIDQNYLSDYRIICPPSDLEVLSSVSASGDWSSKALKEASERSHIIGDVVQGYLKYALGKLHVTFSTDVNTAVKQAAAFREAGIAAECLTGETDDAVRRSILRRFANREIMEIVAVDIISEGFDLPAIEAISMARPTASLAVYMQQFGRALRPMEGKGKAIVIDHAANVLRHQGPPDKPRAWTLGAIEKRKRQEAVIEMKVCPACYEPYEGVSRTCPHCGHYEAPAGRSSPGMVAGDLEELDAEVLARLRAAVDQVDIDAAIYRGQLMDAPQRMPHVGMMGMVNRHRERQDAQATLRHAMSMWGGWRRDQGDDDATMQRRFYALFGMDVLTAQTLGPREALDLAVKLFPTMADDFA
jgi:superfamily II DNA or RNA helicase